MISDAKADEKTNQFSLQLGDRNRIRKIPCELVMSGSIDDRQLNLTWEESRLTISLNDVIGVQTTENEVGQNSTILIHTYAKSWSTNFIDDAQENAGSWYCFCFRRQAKRVLKTITLSSINKVELL